MERRKGMKANIVLCYAIALCLLLCSNVSAKEPQSVSKGKIIGFAEFWAQDIFYLEGEISNLKSECGEE